MRKRTLLTLCLVLLASTAFGFPFGMPPKDNSFTDKVAPDTAPLYYFSWSGKGEADAASSNKVEQALADPELKAVLAGVKEQIPPVDLLPMATDFLKLAMDNAACLYSTNEPGDEFAALVCLGSDGSQASKDLVATMRRLVKDGELKTEMISVGKLKFCKNINSKNDKSQPLYWGFLGKKKEYLVLANTEEGIKALLNNARTPAPQWLTKAKAKLPVEKRSTFSYWTSGDLAEKNLITALKSIPEEQKKMAELGYRYLGATHIEYGIVTSGLEGVGATQKSITVMKDGWESTLPGVLFKKQLTAADLTVIPDNAVFALAGKTSLKDVLDSISMAEAVPENFRDQLNIGAMVAGPYLSSLGDSWSAFVTLDETGVGGAFVGSLKNPSLAKVQLDQLMKMAQDALKGTPEASVSPREMLKLAENQNAQFNVFDEEAEEDEDAFDADMAPGMGAPGMGGGMDPSMLLMAIMPEEIVKTKIGKNDFWLLKKGTDDSFNVVIGIVNKNLVISIKSYAEKYVSFDGKKNLGLNKYVANMMANNPCYLAYIDVSKLAMLPQAQEFPGINQFAKMNLPFVGGIYVNGNKISLDTTSGLPLPDTMITAGALTAISAAKQFAQAQPVGAAEDGANPFGSAFEEEEE